MDMGLNAKTPALTLVMGVLVLALAGVGCGDDDGPAAGTGGAGSGGSGGSGGMSGSGGTGGSTVTVAECATATIADVVGISPLEVAMTTACATCICEGDVAKTVTCNGAANCWELVNCSVVMCAGDMTCAVNMCGSFFSGFNQASALRPEITACADICFPQGIDGGNADGG